ncbi:hypothetical protein CLOSTMETH_02062 [[Clostridium] methylpentosum DSM 5476]|uniref:Uncharacterized protein n=1 Tax=[Clostridium] methylpentosum DSM 5476 TaxID=537013 RepID=C0EDY3_9FIRM|nr:hypothetical protein CLOSTMETH_02062 [[Clostridium] methylpentosum DSM 5476]
MNSCSYDIIKSKEMNCGYFASLCGLFAFLLSPCLFSGQSSGV